ncbi:hypothetical protein [Kitasatospora sp. CB02891]|uniref:hypothetical protein n=1 Tax=Kitasatospora sp. CB02891 TaxID=2020329 RepID=UPI000C27B589|nr:hypothetical protein [Kitasatospora sp. CB02891]PJN29306.1 hypothetical protein CG736_01750 [Kitasatospora sp. CB02891]
MTTDAERNQQLLNELADLSTPEHFGRSLLLSITKHAAARKNPAEPFELTATIKVFPPGAEVVRENLSNCIGHVNSFGSLILVCPPGGDGGEVLV